MNTFSQQFGIAPWWDLVIPDLLKGLPTAVVALFIGVIAAYIAWRQYRVAYGKLNLELFEQRFSVYEVASEYFHGVSNGMLPSSQELNVAIPKARFLMGFEVYAFLTIAKHQALEVQIAQKQWHDSLGTIEAMIYEKAFNDSQDEFSAMTNKLTKTFEPYMNFREWGRPVSYRKQMVGRLNRLRRAMYEKSNAAPKK